MQPEGWKFTVADGQSNSALALPITIPITAHNEAARYTELCSALGK